MTPSMNTPSYSERITLNQKMLYSYIYSLLGNRANAWDVLQETNIILLQKQENFTEGTNFEAWATTIARFQVLAFLRDNKREKLGLLTPEILEYMAVEAEQFAPTMSPRQQALKICRQQLTEKSQKTLKLFYEEGKAIKDIMALLQMKESAVKQTLLRSRRALLDCIENKVHQATS